VGRVIKFFEDVGRVAIRLGGTISAEHGIGTMKKELLREYSRIRDLGNTTCI